MKKSIVFFGLLLTVLTVSTLKAEVKSFVREYTYQAGEADSKLSCRTLALDQVKRLLLEEVGVYLESVLAMQTTEVASETTTSLEDTTSLNIQAITAGFTQTVILEEKWDGITYYLKAKIDLDPDDVLKKVEEFKTDREEMAGVELLKDEKNRALKEIDSLKTLMASLKSENEALKTSSDETQYQQAKNRYYENVAILNSGQYVQQATYAWSIRNYENVLTYARMAIDVNSANTIAYSLAGAAFYKLKQPDSAIVYFDKALSINPRHAKTYFGRGLAYRKMKQYKLALMDFSRAIELKPRFSAAYFERGKVYFKLRKRRLAVKDIRIAARMGHPRARLWIEKAKRKRER